MSGIVKAPVVTAFATELPDTIPMRQLETTAALPGPPTLRPVSAMARSMKNCPAPDTLRNDPKTTNRKMNVADTPSGTPKIPSVRRYWNGPSSSSENPACAIMSGRYGPVIA